MGKNLIKLDYLEYFCQRNMVLLRGQSLAGDDLLVSPLGPHTELSHQQFQEALSSVDRFELRGLASLDEEEPDVSWFVSRRQLERELHELIH
ncbi:MAG: hypothetical protein V3T83_00825 [Acidobacteriota bacterium]